MLGAPLVIPVLVCIEVPWRFLPVGSVVVLICSPRVLRTPLTSTLTSVLSSVVVVAGVSVVPVAVGWILIPVSGLGSLVFWWPVSIVVLLAVVMILLRSGRRTRDVRSVAGVRVTPVAVPLSGVLWRVVLVPVLLRVPGVALSVFSSVGVTTRVGPGVTSVIHDDPLDAGP